MIGGERRGESGGVGDGDRIGGIGKGGICIYILWRKRSEDFCVFRVFGGLRLWDFSKIGSLALSYYTIQSLLLNRRGYSAVSKIVIHISETYY